MSEKNISILNEKVPLKEHIKGFFMLHSFWLSKLSVILGISIILGLICGFVMVILNFLLIAFKFGFSFLPYFVAPIIAGGLTSLLIKVAKTNRIMGTGAAEFVEEVNNPQDIDYHRTKNMIGKTLATSWTYGSGMVCGLEGPGLLIGANIGHLLSQKFNKKHLDLVDFYFISASACTGAILKAPISGALFCSEIPYNNHMRYNSLIFSIIASTVAYIIFCLFFGFKPLIDAQNLNLSPNNINYILLLPLLLLFGIITGSFVLVYMGIIRAIKNSFKRSFEKKIWILPFLGGIGYGILLFFAIPLINTDYSHTLIGPDKTFILFVACHTENVSWSYYLMLTVLFVIAVFLCIGTMNSAGVILPLMLLGALIGGIFGVIFYPEHPELFVLIGISAVPGAATNNPITAIIILIEMTWLPFLFIPAAISTIISYIFSGPSSIIPGQKSVLFGED